MNRLVAVRKKPKSHGRFLSFARNVILRITDNSNFPEPKPTLKTLQAAVSDLEKAQASVHARVRGAVDSRDAKRSKLEQLLDVLRMYVQSVADRDPPSAAAIIQSAGMSVRRFASHGPRGFAITQGPASGCVDVVVPWAGRRAGYEWEWSTDGGKTWRTAPRTLQSKTTLSGFTPATVVLVRCRVTTTAGQGEWSSPLSFMVS